MTTRKTSAKLRWLDPLDEHRELLSRFAARLGVPERHECAARCSCGRWRAVGTRAEVNAEANLHDDAPWRNHIVSIWPVPSPAGSGSSQGRH